MGFDCVVSRTCVWVKWQLNKTQVDAVLDEYMEAIRLQTGGHL